MSAIQPWEGAMATFVSKVCSITICLAAFYMVRVAPAYALQRGGGSVVGSGSSANSNLIIAGNVYYDNHRAAENVPVELRNAEGELGWTASTNASGGFEFRRVNPGTYEVSVNVQGYQQTSMTADLSYSSATGIQIYLKPVPGRATAKTESVSAHELSMPQKARDLMDSGKKKLYQQKDARGGLDDFQQAVAEAPDYYEADYQMGIADLALGKRDDAERSFHKSIDVSGDKYSDADVGLGKIMLDKGDIPAGEKLVRRGIELNASSWQGYYELGRAQLNEKQLADARKSAEQARTLAPGAPAVYRLLANVHQQEKDYPSLLQDLDTYIKLDPDSPAGTRAKQMRDEVQQKIAAQKSADTKP
jgi:predicted Zn-dependent protease